MTENIGIKLRVYILIGGSFLKVIRKKRHNFHREFFKKSHFSLQFSRKKKRKKKIRKKMKSSRKRLKIEKKNKIK